MFKLFFLTNLCNIFNKCFSKKTKNKQKLLKKGNEILNKELDIVRIIKNIRNLKIFSKLLGYEGINKFAIKNSYKNVIEIQEFKENRLNSNDLSDSSLGNSQISNSYIIN